MKKILSPFMAGLFAVGGVSSCGQNNPEKLVESIRIDDATTTSTLKVTDLPSGATTPTTVADTGTQYSSLFLPSVEKMSQVLLSREDKYAAIIFMAGFAACNDISVSLLSSKPNINYSVKVDANGKLDRDTEIIFAEQLYGAILDLNVTPKQDSWFVEFQTINNDFKTNLASNCYKDGPSGKS